MSGVAADVRYTVMDFTNLEGWADDDHAVALDVFRNTCKDMRDPDWRSLCAVASQIPDPKAFFELFFRMDFLIHHQESLTSNHKIHTIFHKNNTSFLR